MLGMNYFRVYGQQILAIMFYEPCDGIVDSRDSSALKYTYEFNESFKTPYLKNPTNSSSRGSSGVFGVIFRNCDE